MKGTEIYSLVRTRFGNARTARLPFEREWILSLAFLMGKQYVYLNAVSHTLHSADLGDNRIYHVDNILLPKWLRQIADLIKTDPEMSVVPATNEDEDIKAAKMATKVLGGVWKNSRMKRKVRKLAGWIYSTGNCFLEDIWDERLGEPKIDPEKGKLYYEGDVDCQIWSPFEIFIPPLSFGWSELEDFPWIIKSKARVLDWFKDEFGSSVEVIPESLKLDSPLLSILSDSGDLGIHEPQAALVEMIQKPSEDYPKGLKVLVANNVVLDKSDYPENRYGLTHFKDLDIPGVFWGQATVRHALQLQKAWNITLSSIREFNRMAKGKFLAPKGCGLEATPNDLHGEVITYKPVMGHIPTVMTLKELPSSYSTILETVQVSIENLFSQHEVSRGTNRSDIRSGDMVELLLEQDAHGRISSHAVFEEALEEVMTRVLRRIQQNYTEERMVKIRGREGEFEIFAFKGADLRQNTDVVVRRQSSLPDSKVARGAQVLSRFKEGLYGDPRDPEVRRQVLNMLDDAVVDNIFGDTRLDEALARVENNLLMQQEKVLINEYDNHNVHIAEHARHRKSLEFQRTKEQAPEEFYTLEMGFQAHVEMHKKFIEAERARIMAQQAAIEKGQKK